jgi:hypothetical protein
VGSSETGKLERRQATDSVNNDMQWVWNSLILTDKYSYNSRARAETSALQFQKLILFLVVVTYIYRPWILELTHTVLVTLRKHSFRDGPYKET